MVDLARAIEVDKRRWVFKISPVRDNVYKNKKNILVENSIFKSASLQNGLVPLKQSAQRTRTFRSFIFDAIDGFLPKFVYKNSSAESYGDVLL